MRFQRGQRFGWEICKWISQTGFINEETESFYFILKSEIIKKKIVFTEYLTDAQKQLKSSQNLTSKGKSVLIFIAFLCKDKK